MLGGVLSILLASAQGPGADERDHVELESGTVLKGRIVLQLEDRLALQVGSRERWIEQSRIKSATSLALSHRQLFADLRKLRSNSIEGLASLASRAEEVGLIHEARLLHWNMLALQPENAAAHEALGHRERNGNWVLPLGKSWARFESAGKYHSDWAKAWQLRSEHFALRSNAPLQHCLNTLYELEYFYLAFFAIFQQDLQLRELLRPIRVSAYGSREEIPSLSNNVGAWFSTDEKTLYTWMQPDGRP
ncbi:MAG: hypothetical protein ACYTG5_21440, partial [Planctomycetota bacterium]